MRRYIRPGIILIIGFIAIYSAWRLKYSFFILEVYIWMFAFVIWIALFARTIHKEYAAYKISKQAKNLSFSALMLAISLTTIFIVYWARWNVNKPTLINTLHDGGFNSCGFDFKTDGTYTFMNAALGLAEYTYGTYTISNDTIKIDRSKLENVVHTNLLVLKRNQGNELWLEPAVENKIPITFDFKVIEDNRNK